MELPGDHRILVVEDDDAIRELVNVVVRRCGYLATTVANGREAIAAIQRDSFCAVLLDLMMPEVNGFELLERMERDSPALLKRVIVMTGAAQRQVARVKAASVWDVIRKPFDIDHLVSSAIACSEGRQRVSA